jgi:TrpR-related protein YerC/YecD
MTKNGWKTKETTELFTAILTLQTVKECEDFFRDLMTEQEIDTFSQRLQVAILLTDEISYRKIATLTGASTATITRVNNWLERGMNGYKTVLKRIGKLSPQFHHHSKKASLAVI